MAGSCLFNYESHYSGLMTDWDFSLFAAFFFSIKPPTSDSQL